MDDDFIDVNDYIKETDIYQIQIDDKVNIKKIGKSKTTDNIIICENIGKDKNISIFSVVYSLNELKLWPYHQHREIHVLVFLFPR